MVLTDYEKQVLDKFIGKIKTSELLKGLANIYTDDEVGEAYAAIISIWIKNKMDMKS
jgi:hypothetical protein